MKFVQLLNEKIYDKATVKTAWGHNLYVEVYKNPSKEEMKKLRGESESFRFGITDNEDIYIWTVSNALHDVIEKKFRLKFKWKHEYYNNAVHTAHKTIPFTDGLLIRLSNMFNIPKISLKRM